jgi:hypothetical protein
MLARCLKAERERDAAVKLAESNGKLAHDTAIELREVRDAFAATLTEIRAEYGGQVADPNCECCDCKFLLRIDKALATLKP